jgi:hypothetical protein
MFARHDRNPEAEQLFLGHSLRRCAAAGDRQPAETMQSLHQATRATGEDLLSQILLVSVRAQSGLV